MTLRSDLIDSIETFIKDDYEIENVTEKIDETIDVIESDVYEILEAVKDGDKDYPLIDELTKLYEKI